MDMVAMAVMAMITTITTTKVAMATGVIMDRIMDMDMVSWCFNICNFEYVILTILLSLEFDLF